MDKFDFYEDLNQISFFLHIHRIVKFYVFNNKYFHISNYNDLITCPVLISYIFQLLIAVLRDRFTVSFRALKYFWIDDDLTDKDVWML